MKPYAFYRSIVVGAVALNDRTTQGCIEAMDKTIPEMLHSKATRILLSENIHRTCDVVHRYGLFMIQKGTSTLRTTNALPLMWDMPWPVFGAVSSAVQITHEDVRTFLFHPQ